MISRQEGGDQSSGKNETSPDSRLVANQLAAAAEVAPQATFKAFEGELHNSRLLASHYSLTGNSANSYYSKSNSTQTDLSLQG